VKKSTRSVVKPGARGTAPSGPAATGESKIVVSNLPPDVNEAQIKVC
jgi:THO complex subunit 4